MTFDSIVIDLPAVVLGLLLLLPVWIMVQAHRSAGFSWAQMLKDADNKESAVRIGIPVSLAVTSYGAMYSLVKWPPEQAINFHQTYLFVWSGALVVIKIIEKWDGRMPFAKAAQ